MQIFQKVLVSYSQMYTLFLYSKTRNIFLDIHFREKKKLTLKSLHKHFGTSIRNHQI